MGAEATDLGTSDALIQLDPIWWGVVVPSIPLRKAAEAGRHQPGIEEVASVPATYINACKRKWFESRCPRFKPVTHCLFDLDGTVVDSELLHGEILSQIIAEHGKVYPPELRHKNSGGTDYDICKVVVKALKFDISAEELTEELLARTAIELPKAPLKKGAERLLKHLYQHKILFALVTNSTRNTVMQHFTTKPHIFNMFHHLVCADDPDNKRGKPSPDPYLLGASKFPDKPKANKCLVFEDTLTGMTAALAAKMQVVVTPASHVPQKSAKKATLVLSSLLEFKPEDFGLPPFEK